MEMKEARPDTSNERYVLQLKSEPTHTIHREQHKYPH